MSGAGAALETVTPLIVQPILNAAHLLAMRTFHEAVGIVFMHWQEERPFQGAVERNEFCLHFIDDNNAGNQLMRWTRSAA